MAKILGKAKITGKGQITIPKVVRVLLEVNPGDYVVFIMEGERIYIEKEK